MIKITRALAKKMYDKGEEIMVVPSKLRPTSYAFKQLGIWTTKPQDDPSADFDKLCNAIFYYNCRPETGMSLAFYSKK